MISSLVAYASWYTTKIAEHIKIFYNGLPVCICKTLAGVGRIEVFKW